MFSTGVNVGDDTFSIIVVMFILDSIRGINLAELIVKRIRNNSWKVISPSGPTTQTDYQHGRLVVRFAVVLVLENVSSSLPLCADSTNYW
jgi:hypothetical protein